MKYTFYPRGVCSREFCIDLNAGYIDDIAIIGGCSGNLQGIMQLLRGMEAKRAIALLKGIRCGSKETSCPDQIAIALQEALEKEE